MKALELVLFLAGLTFELWGLRLVFVRVYRVPERINWEGEPVVAKPTPAEAAGRAYNATVRTSLPLDAQDTKFVTSPERQIEGLHTRIDEMAELLREHETAASLNTRPPQLLGRRRSSRPRTQGHPRQPKWAASLAAGGWWLVAVGIALQALSQVIQLVA